MSKPTESLKQYWRSLEDANGSHALWRPLPSDVTRVAVARWSAAAI